MILAPTLALNSVRGPSVDPDAAAFAATSGATDVAALSAFVKGVKSLGLWNSLVCWPLRSSQNAGTGTTAFSLGGLGTFNGTLVNGPVWTVDGLVTDATNEQINLPDDPNLYNSRSAMVVSKNPSSLSNQRMVEFQTDLSPAGWYMLFFYQGNSLFGASGFRLSMTRNGTSSVNDNSNRTVNLTDFQSGTVTMNDSADSVFRNGSLEVGGSRTGLAAINPTGARNVRRLFGGSAGMTGAFAMTSTATWTSSQVAALHALYRNTLGTGLGLP